ncbi:type I-C CRISPR-associated endonuclease Cas1c [Exiguobacterium aurantiacum]|uniref:type I-C CRISPR-associated endonuclease Cas1c n=1 Tax=Exiguobacterium aurantiacum TaxID=33987 RepID=UPI00087781D7|nr:type I-C CRISPR-associated endonuclease Cas1c [Exiguobacterium aurantiacum]
MKKMLNTLFVNQSDAYLALDGGNVVVKKDDEVLGRVPLHNLEGIVTFGYTGASPALMGYCAENDVPLTFMTKNGRFLARVIGESKGNVVLRKTQYRQSDCELQSVKLARNFILGKVYNQKWMLERTTRDYPMRVDVTRFKETSQYFSKKLIEIRECGDLERLRGLEGKVAVHYNQLFDDMILQQKEEFVFKGRSRRPPLDRVNAMLSFAYSLLARDTGAALEAVGLDAYVGFLHRERPGRISLALDLMEELRGIYADRFVLSLINMKVIQAKHFVQKENGAVLMTEEGRKVFLSAWQKRKQEMIHHPYLKEKMMWGLVPYAQALLLARHLRGDLEEYPTFLYK